MNDAELSAACERAFALLPNLPPGITQQTKQAIARTRRLLNKKKKKSK
jgi:hypothetical protein